MNTNSSTAAAVTTRDSIAPYARSTEVEPRVQTVNEGTGGPIRRSQVGQRLTRFVFTLNNYNEVEINLIKTAPVKWLIFGKEIGSNGTPHLQGACVIGKQVAFSTVKTWPGFGRCHIEKMRGTVQESVTYCTKEDSNFVEIGERPLPNGKQTGLTNAVSRVREGARLADLAQDDEGATAVVKFHKGLIYLRSILLPQRTTAPTVIWLHGDTGVGKTRYALELSEREFGQHNYWISSGGLRWFDGYDGQPVAIFDDFRTKHVSHFSFLLRLLDRYPVQCEIKGGYVHWIPRLIIITTCHDIRQTWSFSTDENLRQLERRVTHQFHLPDELDSLLKLSFDQTTRPSTDLQDVYAHDLSTFERGTTGTSEFGRGGVSHTDVASTTSDGGDRRGESDEFSISSDS